ncbi:universal stress protein [Sphaerisporangium corydalis]|uniref:Universal stress protein n=1 Tax=Sphaerisporangium corydalis TaxID=1441875 RepID=A0ABV9E6W2_9ACTN|nr:universal stress protein [Sphaerisporangium corydalis]
MAGLIVVGVDGSPSAAAAVEWAADDALSRGARLRIVHVWEPWSYDFPLKAVPGSLGSLPAYWRGVLARAVDFVHGYAPAVETSAALVTGAVSERLTAESEDADALILGSRGASGLTGMLLGSVGRAVAGHATGPVVVVRRFAPTRHGEIVVGFDGSEPSLAALDYALQEAGARGARVRVLHAWRGRAFARRGRDGPAESREVQRRLEPWRERYPDVRMVGWAVRGNPVRALADASRSADLVVVGSRARGAFSSAVLGSVSHGVLRRAHCPVAIVRPRDPPAAR